MYPVVFERKFPDKIALPLLHIFGGLGEDNLFAIAGVLISVGVVMIWVALAGPNQDRSGLGDDGNGYWLPSDSEPGTPISNMTGELTVVRGGGNEFNAFNQ